MSLHDDIGEEFRFYVVSTVSGRHWGRMLRVGCGGHRDVPIRYGQPIRRIKPAPAGAWQIHLGPGVQVVRIA